MNEVGTILFAIPIIVMMWVAAGGAVFMLYALFNTWMEEHTK